MPFSEKTKIVLFGLSGNQCAFPKCDKPLIFKVEQIGSMANIGEAAHIVSEKANGPRGKDPLPADQRNEPANGLILCSPHHTIIDDNPEGFSVEQLREWKTRHEQSFLKNAHDTQSQTDLFYADCVDRWGEGVHLSDWLLWSETVLLEGAQGIRADIQENIQQTCLWLMGRIWPGTNCLLEVAFSSFRLVSHDFMRVFSKHWELNGSLLRTEKFYRKRPARVWRASIEEYQFHVRLIDDLMLELTRAANLICDRVRQCLDASFRMTEGKVTARSGMYDDWSTVVHFAEYNEAEREQTLPYPGLERFMDVRSQRDFAFGSGVRANYLAGAD